MNTRFNENFNDRGEKPWFIYKPNPLVEKAFQIFMYQPDKNDYEPAGEYTVLDKEEPKEISEKMVMNIVTSLNGGKGFVDIQSHNNAKILYNVLPKTSDSEQSKIMFRAHDGKGVSKENALLVLDKGVLKDETKT